jgi:hypothetical protein
LKKGKISCPYHDIPTGRGKCIVPITISLLEVENIWMEDRSWRIRMNIELNELIGNADIVRFIKSSRIAWLGHVTQMDDKRTHKRILQWKPIGTRTRGRPRKRGIEEVLKIMGIRRWREQCEERVEWKNITEKAETHSGLQRQ